MTTLTEHFERDLGPIEVGWTSDADGNRLPFQVVKFDRVPLRGLAAFATLGLSRHPVQSRTSGKEIRLELLLLVHADQTSGPFPAILQDIAKETILAGKSILRGDVLGPKGPLTPGSAMEAFYVTAPVYLPDEFASADEDGNSIVIAWLVPVSGQEAAFIRDRGWPAFEDLLVEVDPDLADLNRPSILL